MLGQVEEGGEIHSAHDANDKASEGNGANQCEGLCVVTATVAVLVVLLMRAMMEASFCVLRSLAFADADVRCD